MAEWTRLSAISILKSDRMPSILDFINKALAASSVVGASSRDKGLGEEIVENRLVFVGVLLPLFSASDLDSSLDLALEKLGRMLTGIIITFLNDVRKSRLSACRLTFDIKNDSVEAACSESWRSQSFTVASEVFRKKSSSSAR